MTVLCIFSECRIITVNQNLLIAGITHSNKCYILKNSRSAEIHIYILTKIRCKCKINITVIKCSSGTVILFNNNCCRVGCHCTVSRPCGHFVFCCIPEFYIFCICPIFVLHNINICSITYCKSVTIDLCNSVGNCSNRRRRGGTVAGSAAHYIVIISGCSFRTYYNRTYTKQYCNR